MDIENKQIAKEKALLQALKTILKPMVRLLIRENITYIGLLGLLKHTYVKVAEESFKLDGKRQTDSRISLLTGVHRADVKKIRSKVKDKATESQIKASLSAQIMSIWMGHQAYLNEQGSPKILFRYECDGSPSFEQLVLSISKDKHPRSFIDDWVNQGIIHLNQDDGKETVELTEKAYVPEENYEEKLFFTGKNIGDHLSVVVFNLENKKLSMFDRAVYYSELTEDSVTKLEEVSKKKMMQVLIEVNQLANELQKQDLGKEGADKEMHVGAYFYRAQQKGEKNE